MASNGKHCAGTRRDGRPCGGTPLPGRLHCWAHAPELAAAREAAYQRGGQHRANVVRLRALVPPRLAEVYDRLETALGEVHEGTLPPGRALAMAALASAMVRVMTTGQIEERLRALEARAQ